MEPYTKINENLILINEIKFEDSKYVKELSKEYFVIFPHEWNKNQNQILSHFNSYENELIKIHARKCEVKEIDLDTLRKFCDSYHIQKSNKLGLIGWGIFHNKELLGILSLGKHPRKTSEHEIILDRLCFKEGIRINGGASKLFSTAVNWAKEQLTISKIISYSDNRISKGNVYKKLNFKLEKEIRPDYFYLDKNNFLLFKSKQSQKKSNVNCPKDLSEKEFCKQKNLFQVFDAGKLKWSYEIKKQYASNNPIKFRIKGYYDSKKGGLVYYQSSYELRAVYLLENDENVISFSNQVIFHSDYGKRYIDFLVKYNDDKYSIIEVKPFRRIEDCKNQIDDNIIYAKKNNWDFKIWSEKELGFTSEHFILKWAEQYLLENDNLNFSNIKETRRIKKNESAKKYYNTLLQNKISIYCDFCKDVHEVLKRSYDNNVKRNNTYICERYGGFLAGSKPKIKLIKNNPYENENKKQCTNCKEIKDLSEFWKDKSRRDGYSNKCIKCKKI